MNKVAVLIDSELVGELFLRRGPKIDLSDWIENIVGDFLERTVDAGDWDDAYYAYLEQSKSAQGFAKEFGDPDKGYSWTPLFLPNGTRVSMEYKGRQYHAEVRREQFLYEGKPMSPSEFASTVANNTRRNAWRDLNVKRPRDSGWIQADALRHRQRVVS
jgi:hypothetical protein